MAKSKRHTGWTRLDNAAKIFPPTSDKRDPKVFRFSCELSEEVNPDILQTALDQTLERFSGFLTVLKHGFFWYYLENTDLRPSVHIENTQICTPLFDRNVHSLLVDVSYFHMRINFEVFHALTDGTGAVEFLKSLVCRYLELAHQDDFPGHAPGSGFDASNSERWADSFQKYYNPKEKKGILSPAAYKVRGSRLSENRIKVVEGIMPVDKVLALARSHNTTMTVLLTSILLCSLHSMMSLRDCKKPVAIAVPVNLRNHFSSGSTRNFFAVVSIRYNFSRNSSELADVISSVAAQLKQMTAKESLAQQINALVSMEKNIAIRAIPLVLKDFGLKIAYAFNDRSVTAALSNVGSVKLPQAYHKYIRLFDVMTSTKKLQICMCSFQNHLVINFTDSFLSADVQKTFFRTLANMGVPIEIITNPLEDEKEKS